MDLNKERDTVHNSINTLFDIAKVQLAEINMLKIDIANKQSKIDELEVVSKSLKSTNNMLEEINDDFSNSLSCLKLELEKAKSQAVPDGFVLVRKEPTVEIISHITNTPIEVNHLCDHADVFLSHGEAEIAYKAMIQAQELAHD
ncbi:hypothetical protein [Acinetobacter gerneri]|uniref:hypothetical protein n=1 Tax=Acinetobacter gerneri TaxID=202952 RepID=UPI0028ACE9AA|nr:hypothetical protein [Acinetobacter gerneri]